MLFHGGESAFLLKSIRCTMYEELNKKKKDYSKLMPTSLRRRVAGGGGRRAEENQRNAFVIESC